MYLDTGWDIRIVCVYSVIQYMVGYVPVCTLVRDGTLGLYVCTVSYSAWLGTCMYQCVPWYVSTGWDIRIVCVYSVIQYSTWLGMYQCVPWYVSTGWDIRIVYVYSVIQYSTYMVGYVPVCTLVRDGTLGLYVCTVSSSTWLGMYYGP